MPKIATEHFILQADDSGSLKLYSQSEKQLCVFETLQIGFLNPPTVKRPERAWQIVGDSYNGSANGSTLPVGESISLCASEKTDLYDLDIGYRIIPDSPRLGCRISIVYKDTVSLEYERLRLVASTARGQFLDRSYKLKNLAPKDSYIDRWTPHICCLDFGVDKFSLTDDNGMELMAVRTRRGVTYLDLYLSDKDSMPHMECSPIKRVRPGVVVRRPGEQVTAEANFMISSEFIHPIRKERYPFGYRSCVVFTDHADYDCPRRLNAVFYGTDDSSQPFYGKKGIVGTGLTATKSVFVVGNKDPEEEISKWGMDNSEVKSLFDRLHCDGVEIAAHTTTGWSRPIDRQALRAHLEILGHYRARTWIDHGPYGHQNITNEGWNPESPHFILDILHEFGYKYFWSYIDFCTNPPSGNLNLLSSEGMGVWSYLKRLFTLHKRPVSKLAKKGQLVGVFVNQLSEMLESVFGMDFRRQFSELIGAKTWGKLVSFAAYLSHNFSQAVGRMKSPNVYVLKGLTLYRNANLDRVINRGNGYFFTTIFITNFGECYAPRNIDKLIAQKGMHIGHTYLGSVNPYMPDGTCHWDGQRYVISPLFQKNLEYMKLKQDKGLLWVTTIGELGDYLDGLAKVFVVNRAPGETLVRNSGDTAIKGFTASISLDGNSVSHITVNGNLLKSFKNDGEEAVFWFDLPPKTDLTVKVHFQREEEETLSNADPKLGESHESPRYG